MSNSYHFELNGWDTYCIEAAPNLLEAFKIRKNNVIGYALSDYNADDVDFFQNTVHTPASFSTLVIDPAFLAKHHPDSYSFDKIKTNVRTFDSILEITLSHLKNIDILSMDVLKGFNIDKWKPTIIFVEEHNFKNGDAQFISFY